MYILDAQAKIGDYTFNSIHDVEITKSVDELSDTAIIKLPSRFTVKQNGVQKYTEEAIKIGDEVKITLAYVGKYSGVEFVGYVKKISAKVPVEIHCEDSMWKLRQNNINKTWPTKTSVKEILQEVVKGTKIKLASNIPDIPLDKWIINNANGAQVLESFKKDLALTSFINDAGELYCGLEQFTNIGQTAVYDFNYNLVQNNLEFKFKEDRRIKVEYEYINPKTNKRDTVEVGDADGEKRSYKTSVVSDRAVLEKLAKSKIEKLKYDGFDGDVESFLIPFATRGMKAKIIDDLHTNRSGNYFIKKVVTRMGLSGERRTVSIGQKL